MPIIKNLFHSAVVDRLNDWKIEYTEDDKYIIIKDIFLSGIWSKPFTDVLISFEEENAILYVDNDLYINNPDTNYLLWSEVVNGWKKTKIQLPLNKPKEYYFIIANLFLTNPNMGNYLTGEFSDLWVKGQEIEEEIKVEPAILEDIEYSINKGQLQLNFRSSINNISTTIWILNKEKNLSDICYMDMININNKIDIDISEIDKEIFKGKEIFFEFEGPDLDKKYAIKIEEKDIKKIGG